MRHDLVFGPRRPQIAKFRKSPFDQEVRRGHLALCGWMKREFEAGLIPFFDSRTTYERPCFTSGRGQPDGSEVARLFSGVISNLQSSEVNMRIRHI